MIAEKIIRLASCKESEQRQGLEKFVQDSGGVQLFAALIGYDQSTIQRWLSGPLPVPLVVLRLIDAERKFYAQFLAREKLARQLKQLKKII